MCGPQGRTRYMQKPVTTYTKYIDRSLSLTR